MSSFSQITQCRWSLERKFIHELSNRTNNDPDKLREALPVACVAKVGFAAALILDISLTTCYAGAVSLCKGIANNEYESCLKGAGMCLGGKMLLSRSLVKFVWVPVALGTGVFHGIDVGRSPLSSAKDKVIDVWAKILFLAFRRSYSLEQVASQKGEVAQPLSNMKKTLFAWERYLLKVEPYSNETPSA